MAEKRPAAQPRYLDGKALRRKRLEAGLEQAQLAEMCGTDRPAVTHWERGDYGCRIGMLHKLAQALGCQPADLMLQQVLDGDDEQEPGGMSEGYVYVLAFANGTVKVGRTQNTGQRLNAHKSAARKFGLTVIDQWLSPPHAEWLENEEALKKIAADLGGTAHSKEYFGGVDFAAVAEKARELTFTAAAESVTGQPVPRAGRVPAQATRGGATARERAIRLDGLRAGMRRAQDEAKARGWDYMMAGVVSALLDVGAMPPAVWHKHAAAAAAAGKEADVRLCLSIATAMEAQIREEAAFSARFTKAVA